MPMFSKESFSKLSTCHIDLQTLFFEVIKHRDCTIIEGHRDQAAQELAFSKGFSKLHYPYGNHNATPSNAVDVMEDPIDYTDQIKIHQFAGFVFGIAAMLKAQGKMTHSIRWGGNWSTNINAPNASFYDGAHFELF